MQLTWYRIVVIVIALAVTTAGLWSRWRSGDVVDTYKDRALQICPQRLVAQGFDGEALSVREDMSERWDWGRFEFQSAPFADSLNHRDAAFEAVRASLYTPLDDGADGETRCRLAVCIYSVPLDDAMASVREGQCGGIGGHRLVTPSLKPDILNQQYDR